MSEPGPGADRPRASRVVHLTVAERSRLGLDRRQRVPRSAHGKWSPAADRADPIGLLQAQDTTRIAELVPVRYGRMLEAPFAFLRGSATVMAHDLSTTPVTGIDVQLCGDAHLSNFGIFSSPERTLLFDVNDFDETLRGPFEWDVKRLAASFVAAGRSLGWSPRTIERATLAAVGSYRTRIRKYAAMAALELWYSRLSMADIRAMMSGTDALAQRRLNEMEARASSRDHVLAFNKLTTVTGGQRLMAEQPPLIVRPGDAATEQLIRDVFRAYRRTLQPDRRQLLERYTYRDIARKVVGVGSVGTRCFVLFLTGRDDDDPMFLQVKEANASVLEPYLGSAPERNHGERVVNGQRLMQSASDIFLGWIRAPGGIDFYWRQLWDGKFSVPIEVLRPSGASYYGAVCGWTLARAHARSGDGVQIAAYLGTSDTFDRAILEFAHAYADQTEKDHAALRAAVDDGRVVAQLGT